MQPQSAVHYGLPGYQKIQLQPPFVLVLNPQHAVLVFIESGHQNPLETRHQFFTLAGR
ncbi:hypothetical protein [Enterobacter cloacae complex sp. 2DZ2F2B]|uniref:hypothetical protein n=1 Tax=Enterobacter cloacae complex sp. 2DZ2F2B TaxID=2511984 RepID=UPI0013EC4DCE|nr:hypothetical protein [Enterobacter cloacae complex sp. 2DZ2F2B]